MSTALIPLADGFEEIEAMTIIDILRRAGIEVTTAALTSKQVQGSHQITVIADGLLSEIDIRAFDLIVLPGGPGVKSLQTSTLLRSLLEDHYHAGKLIGAICAAPIVLSLAGFLKGRRVTSFPTIETELDCGEYLYDAVVIDGQVVTSRGPGTAMLFSLKLVELLRGRAAMMKLQKELVFA